MSVGLRVVRGKDWYLGNRDGGEGHLGTVVTDNKDDTWEVIWDIGNITQCRAGKDGKYDLKILSNCTIGVKHSHIHCDECDMRGIIGLRWKCSVCYDYDLCSVCYFADKHDLHHPFKRFVTPSSFGVDVPRRADSQKIEMKGIYYGAEVVRGPDWEYGNEDGGSGNEGRILNVCGSGMGYCNMVKVGWADDTIKAYRRGCSGKVDVKCIVAASNGYYYKDHLPTAGERKLPSKSNTYQGMNQNIPDVQKAVPLNLKLPFSIPYPAIPSTRPPLPYPVIPSTRPPPPVCKFYNLYGCNRAGCKYLHICKGFVEETCDGCAMSHNIKSEHNIPLLSSCGFDITLGNDQLAEMYKVRRFQGSSIPQRWMPKAVASESESDDEGQMVKGFFGDVLETSKLAKNNEEYTDELSDGSETLDSSETESESEDEASETVDNSFEKLNLAEGSTDSSDDIRMPYLVCKRYNKKLCNHPRCKYMHICGKFILDLCDEESCDLNHRLFYLNNKNVLNKARYRTDKNERVLLKEYIRKAQLKMYGTRTGNEPQLQNSTAEMNDKYQNFTGKQEAKEKSRKRMKEAKELKGKERERGTHARESMDTEVEAMKYPYLVCRNYNTKRCNFNRCKRLHVCCEFMIGKCDKGIDCKKNHSLFCANNENVLRGAGFNTNKSELEVFIDYRMQLADTERKQENEKRENVSENQGFAEISFKNSPKGSRSDESKDSDAKRSGIQEQRAKTQNPLNRSFDDVKEAQKPDKRKKRNKDTIQFDSKNDIQGTCDKTSSEETNMLMKQDYDPDICRANIRQRCKYGDTCYKYHCDLPYLWQYKVPTLPWTPFPDIVNETLEMNYCNKDIETTIMAVASDMCEIDFSKMKGKMKDGDISLRRLSTCSFCEAPPGETLVTQWRWFWKHDNGGWIQYGDDAGRAATGKLNICNEIEEKHIENPTASTAMQIGGFQYMIDFKTFKQTNRESGKQREMRRRPVFKSKSEVEKEAKEKRKLVKTVDQKQQQSSQQTSTSGLPTHWTPMADDEEEMRRVLLSKTDKEYKQVMSIFRSSLGRSNIQISSIERIQNQYLWQNYAWKRKTMEKQTTGANEMMLYHGTLEENIDPICKTNFDWRLYGTSVGNVYGQGSYFAADAKYSDTGYANYGKDGYKSIFIVRVLVGKYTRGSKTLRRPPPVDPRAPKGKIFDCTVDDVANPKIYCVFHDSQYYPEYLIKFR